MPLSYKNLISGNKIKDVLAGNSSSEDILKKQTITPKYVKGYESESFWENIFGGQLQSKNNPELQSRFGQLFNMEDKKIDPYDPYTTSDAKKEEHWGGWTSREPNENGKPGRILFPEIDEDVNTFRNILFPDSIGATQYQEEQYEDPLQLGFEVSFDENSPFFSGNETGGPYNSMGYFMNKYFDIGEIGWRNVLWSEFKDRIFTIFEKNTGNIRNVTNKPYYIQKIAGLNNLNKKIIKYGEDKLTITLNEDVRMISWYLSELYNNIVYSYKNKRMMFPENLIRFNMHIKMHDFRNFIMPYKDTNVENEGKINYKDSPKSTIMFTLHDCSFNFFNSYNFKDDITLAGYDASTPPRSELQFDIIYKSVTRWSDYPLLNPSTTIDPWVDFNSDPLETRNEEIDFFKNLRISKSDKLTNKETKSYWEEKLTSSTQTVANAGLNYLNDLETKLREERGKFVEDTLQKFRDWTTINKIEPDNVYNKDFNNRISLKNAGRQLASDLLNDLEGDARNISNF